MSTYAWVKHGQLWTTQHMIIWKIWSICLNKMGIFPSWKVCNSTETINNYFPKRMGMTVGCLVTCYMKGPETHSRPPFTSSLWTGGTSLWPWQGTVKPRGYFTFPRSVSFYPHFVRLLHTAGSWNNFCIFLTDRNFVHFFFLICLVCL